MSERTQAVPISVRVRSAILRAVIPRTPYRRLTRTIWVLLVCVALTLLTIGARSPYTHANLSAGYDPSYDRTAQIVIGAPTEFEGVSPSTATAAGGATTRGASLYVTAGCVTCHGLEGRGAVIGPPIAGTDFETVLKRVREGPSGMPKFSVDGLSDAQIADITAYLDSLTSTK
ncbi:MAG TPA: cytochrome c [Candidatus Limnocylindria bacterium]|jgi:mono/diheme cytochrome c family protein